MTQIPQLEPIFNEKIVKQLIRDEGKVAHAYYDSLGFLTIGVGHLIDARKGGTLPDFIITTLLEHDIEKHGNELFAALPWAKNLDPPRRAVLINMAFNLGVKGLLGFANTLAAVKDGAWANAAHRMLQSKWADQVGARATRLAEQMRTGEWVD